MSLPVRRSAHGNFTDLRKRHWHCLGTLASLAGNEAAIYFGRRPFVSAAILGSVVLALLLALFGVQSYPFGGGAHARLWRGDLAGLGIAHSRDGGHRRPSR